MKLHTLALAVLVALAGPALAQQTTPQDTMKSDKAQIKADKDKLKADKAKRKADRKAARDAKKAAKQESTTTK